jgi:hypothetical protein
VTSFIVTTIDGKARVFEDNAEGFLVRWQEALNDPERQWPYAYLEAQQRFVNGISYVDARSAVHFNPLSICAVEVRMEEE